MPEARAHLPEAWAQQARCPVCSQRPLNVVQSTGQPDRLACQRCGTQFEMEVGGQQVRLVQVPPILPAEWAGTWVKAADIQTHVRQVAQAARERRTPAPSAPSAPPAAPPAPSAPQPASAAAAPQPIPTPAPAPRPAAAQPESRRAPETRKPAAQPRPTPPPPPPLPEAAVQSAEKLYQLGNRPAAIREIVSRSHKLSAEQLDRLVAPYEARENQRRSRASRSLIIGLVAVVLVLACVIGGSFVLRSLLAIPGQITDAVEGTAPANTLPRESLPPQLQTLVPSGTDLLLPPTPAVQTLPTGAAPAASGCPRTPQDAAALFGGPAERWTSNNNGWVIIGTDPISVYVPEKMTAGYVVIGTSMEMRSIAGPARLENVYMVAVNCTY